MNRDELTNRDSTSINSIVRETVLSIDIPMHEDLLTMIKPIVNKNLDVEVTLIDGVIMDIVMVNNLTKIYQSDIVGIEDVSFKVRKRSIFCLLGPNGAGKTTTINILSTVIKPTRGSAYVCGYDVVKEAKEVRKHILLIPQEIALDAIMNVLDNLVFFDMLLGLSRAEAKRRALEILEVLDLKDRARSRIIDLSGGMMRKVQLARAFMAYRDVVFLDEPTAMLDYISRKRVWSMIRELVEKGSTVILATNELEEAEAVCEDVLFLKNRVVAYGDINEVKKLMKFYKLEIVLRDRDDLDRVISILKPLGIEFLELNNNRVTAMFNIDKISTDEIIHEISRTKIRIDEIKIVRPTLSEVFTLLFSSR